MTLQLPAFTEDQKYPFSYLRLLLASISEAGVVTPTDLAVTPATGLQVQIAAGKAFVPQTVALSGAFYQGLYEIFNDASASPYNQFAAPVSNPRVDRVVARVYDVNEQQLGGSSYARFEWVEGTEQAGATLVNLSGIAPLPANSLDLANVLRLPGESSILSANIKFVATVASGGGTEALVEITTSQTLAAGNRYLITPSSPVTLTLPASIDNAEISIVAGGGTSAANTVTIVNSTGGTMAIFTEPREHLDFEGDGTNWYAVGGEYDSGWYACGNTGSPGFTGTVLARIKDGRLQLKGTITFPSGTYAGSQTGLSLPFGGPNSDKSFIVPVNVGAVNPGIAFSGPYTGGGAALAVIDTSGNIRCSVGFGGPNPDIGSIDLSSISYPIYAP